MPELNPDLPQVEAQGAVGGISPNLEEISAAGRGMEKAGSDIADTGYAIYQRKAQEEVADVYSAVASAREKYNENLDNALRTGQLDTDQFSQNMKDETDKIGEGLSTAQGRNFFERQQARLQGAMLLRASHVSGQIAYNNTVDSMNQAVDVTANTASQHPEQFPDLIDQSEEMLDASVKNGQLPAGMEERYRKQFHAQIAYGAGLGLAESDPGKAADGTPNENRLSATLKRLDPADQSDPSNLYRYLSPQQIEALQSHAKMMDNGRAIGESQALANQEKLMRLKGQLFMNQNSQAILTGQMDPKTVISNPNVTLQEKDMVLRMMAERTKASVKSDPAYVNSIEDKIVNGEISSRDQLTEAYKSGEGKISAEDYFRLAPKIDSTPDGQIVKNLRQQFLKMGDEQIKFKGVGGAFTDAGDTANLRYRQELDQAEQAFTASGKGTPRDFYSNLNPKDPSSPIAIKNKYILGLTQKAQMGAQEAMGQVNGQPTGIQYSTSPTKDIPQPPPQPPTFDPGMKQPNESFEQWRKRPDSNFNKRNKHG